MNLRPSWWPRGRWLPDINVGCILISLLGLALLSHAPTVAGMLLLAAWVLALAAVFQRILSKAHP